MPAMTSCRRCFVALACVALGLGTATTRAGVVPIQWVGGGGNSLWSTSANWDPPISPCNTQFDEFDVTIPGGVTVIVDVAGCEITSFSLAAGSTLRPQAGADLTVQADTFIGGLIDAQGGHFTAIGANVTTGSQCRLYAQSGSVVRIATTSYSSAGLPSLNSTILSAAGPGTLLDLSSVETLSTAFNDGSNTVRAHTITATNGGTIDLSSCHALTTPVQSTDRVFVNLSGDQALLDWSVLTTVNGSGYVTSGVADAVWRVGSLGGATRNVDINLNDALARLEAPGSLFLNSLVDIVAAARSQVAVGNWFDLRHGDENDEVLGSSIVNLNGDGTPEVPQLLEVGGVDFSCGVLSTDNFGFGQLVVGQDTQATTVLLRDEIVNAGGGGPEALHLFGLGPTRCEGAQSGLHILGGSTLVIPEDINVYAWQVAGEATVGGGQFVNITALLNVGETIPYDGGFIQKVEAGGSGACCLVNGDCQQLDRVSCYDQSGLYQGPGTVCGFECPTSATGACCFGSGLCMVVPFGTCVSFDGAYQGDDTTCEADCPPAPVGACCFNDFSCQDDLTGAECVTAGGPTRGPARCAPTKTARWAHAASRRGSASS